MITADKSLKTSVVLSNGQHQIISDVAQTLGGGDEGLNPHELIEAALAACTILTLEMYAKRKSWDLTDMKVEVRILQEGADSTIERKIAFGSQCSEEQRTRLLEIANKCPIHRLLESNIKVSTTLL